jgi:hypothetical protein
VAFLFATIPTTKACLQNRHQGHQQEWGGWGTNCSVRIPYEPTSPCLSVPAHQVSCVSSLLSLLHSPTLLSISPSFTTFLVFLPRQCPTQQLVSSKKNLSALDLGVWVIAMLLY